MISSCLVFCPPPSLTPYEILNRARVNSLHAGNKKILSGIPPSVTNIILDPVCKVGPNCLHKLSAERVTLFNLMDFPKHIDALEVWNSPFCVLRGHRLKFLNYDDFMSAKIVLFKQCTLCISSGSSLLAKVSVYRVSRIKRINPMINSMITPFDAFEIQRWKIEHLLCWSKCSIFNNIFKSIQNFN